MNIRCRGVPYEFDSTIEISEIIRQYNFLKLDDNVTQVLLKEYEKLNEGNLPPTEQQILQIPVLLPFLSQHAKGKFVLNKEAIRKQIKRELATGTKNYRTFPYSFCRTGDTIIAVIRLYNDMNLDEKMIGWLLDEFNTLNEHAIPPRLGQTVQVPVLLPFCVRHEKDKTIFENSKNL